MTYDAESNTRAKGPRARYVIKSAEGNRTVTDHAKVVEACRLVKEWLLGQRGTP